MRESPQKMVNWKAPGIDGGTMECLKIGSVAMIECSVRLMNVCYITGRAPKDRCRAIIMLLYKRKGNKCECGNFKGINPLSVIGKLYGKILVVRVRHQSESVLRQEQCGFRSSRNGTDQIFVVRQMCEKFLARERCTGPMNLKKT